MDYISGHQNGGGSHSQRKVPESQQPSKRERVLQQVDAGGRDLTHEQAGMVYACPACDKTVLRQFKNRERGELVCNDCHEVVNPGEVVERASYVAQSEEIRALEQADADDIITDGGVVPEDFTTEDLRTRLHGESTTDERFRLHCPECGRADARKRTGGYNNRNVDHDYYCGKCGETFDPAEATFGGDA